MDKQRDGGPAFPASVHPSQDSAAVMNGMTLRDHFAGQALAGMLNHPNAWENPHQAAMWAYEFADAMIEVREVSP